MELSERQRQILSVIREAVKRQGYPPTVREIAAEVGLASPASVQNHLHVLEEKGLIRRGGSKRRALELVESRRQRRAARPGHDRRLPVVGRVAAGEPLLAEQNVEEFLTLPDFLAADRESFVLRVKGDSMIRAGILDGDLVVVRRQDQAANGEIVVALLDDEATLKRFFLEKDHVRLQPENDTLEPIFAKEPRILGKVTGVMRKL
jgi:repressor LexA